VYANVTVPLLFMVNVPTGVPSRKACRSLICITGRSYLLGSNFECHSEHMEGVKHETELRGRAFSVFELIEPAAADPGLLSWPTLRPPETFASFGNDVAEG